MTLQFPLNSSRLRHRRPNGGAKRQPATIVTVGEAAALLPEKWEELRLRVEKMAGPNVWFVATFGPE